jgi:hypothetical protein
MPRPQVWAAALPVKPAQELEEQSGREVVGLENFLPPAKKINSLKSE